MIRLNEPRHTFLEVLSECSAGITGNAALLTKIEFGRGALITEEGQYLKAARAGELYLVTRVHVTGGADPVVVSDLKKSELIKIYDQYFVPEGKPARKIYDSLLNAAKEKCPFCGGIGRPRNLDHFLPKAHFPQFSILPSNLVPACRDCNMGGKATSFATSAEDQIIQPYVDNDRFFLEQWISAIYHVNVNVNVNIKNEPGEFEYFVNPPSEWCPIDKKRVVKHFHDFDLARRYATKAAEQLGTVLLQICSMRRAGLDDATVKGTLLEPGVESTLFVNHWQKIMYQALIEALIKALI